MEQDFAFGHAYKWQDLRVHTQVYYLIIIYYSSINPQHFCGFPYIIYAQKLTHGLNPTLSVLILIELRIKKKLSNL